MKRKTICILDQVFPEYEKIFSDVFGKTSKENLMIFESFSNFADISTEKLEKILENITLKGFAKKKLKVISEAAKTSFGISYGLQSLIFQLRQLIAQINFIEQQVKQLEKKIFALLKSLNSPITTIPGVGEINGAMVQLFLVKLATFIALIILKSWLLSPVLMPLLNNQAILIPIKPR